MRDANRDLSLAWAIPTHVGKMGLDGAERPLVEEVSRVSCEKPLEETPPEVRPVRLGILLLAAGGSSRMGTQKMLLPWGKSTVVGQALAAALGAGLEQVVVVTGSDADRVEEACRAASNGQAVQFVCNPDWAMGMLSSIRVGLNALDPTLDGFFVALGDMPLIPPDIYLRLRAVFREASDRYVLPVFEGKRGHPVLFPVSVVGQVEGPPTDAGLRSMLQRFPERVLPVPVAEPGVCLDLDTPEQYAAAAKTLGSELV